MSTQPNKDREDREDFKSPEMPVVTDLNDLRQWKFLSSRDKGENKLDL